MKIGNISQTVLKRSVLKQIRTKREEAALELSVEEMCAGVFLEDENTLLISSTAIYGDEKDLGCYGIAKVINDVASRNAKPVGVDVVIQLPPYAYESRLKAMVAHMEECCEKHHLQMLGIKASVCPVINSAMIYVTGIGIVEKDLIIQTAKAKPQMDLVLVGSVGTEGALRIYHAKKEKLEERFISSFFKDLLKQKERLMLIEEMELAVEEGAIAIHQVGDSGILGALWEVGEAGKLGLEVDLKKMTIRQDVIEICEFTGINPYQLSSIGSALIVIEQGETFVEKLQAKNIEASIIGRTTSSNERIILNGGERRFLDRPTQGEFAKLYEQEEE